MFDPFSAPQSFTITTPVAAMTTNNTTAPQLQNTGPEQNQTNARPIDLTNTRASLFILLGLNDFVLIESGWRT